MNQTEMSFVSSGILIGAGIVFFILGIFSNNFNLSQRLFAMFVSVIFLAFALYLIKTSGVENE